MLWGCKRLKVGWLKNFLLLPGTTATLLGVKPLMPLGSLLIPASDGLKAYIMIPISRRSQVLTLLPQSNQPQYLKSLQLIKPFLLLWKSQQIPTQMLVKGKKLRLPRVRIITKKRIKVRLQILPLLSPNELLTPKLPRQKLRILVLVLRLFSMFTVFAYIFFLKTCTLFSLLLF